MNYKQFRELIELEYQVCVDDKKSVGPEITKFFETMMFCLGKNAADTLWNVCSYTAITKDEAMKARYEVIGYILAYIIVKENKKKRKDESE